MLVVSFATDDAHYAPMAKTLRADCDRFGIRHDIQVIKPFSKDTQAHCAHKAAHIKSAWLDSLRNEEDVILWLDVDSRITGALSVPDGDWDVGWCRNPMLRTNPKAYKVTGGAYAFRATPAAGKFIDKWVKDCRRYRPGTPADHRRFNSLVISGGPFVFQDITDGLRGKLEFWTHRGTKRLVV